MKKYFGTKEAHGLLFPEFILEAGRTHNNTIDRTHNMRDTTTLTEGQRKTKCPSPRGETGLGRRPFGVDLAPVGGLQRPTSYLGILQGPVEQNTPLQPSFGFGTTWSWEDLWLFV